MWSCVSLSFTALDNLIPLRGRLLSTKIRSLELQYVAYTAIDFTVWLPEDYLKFHDFPVKPKFCSNLACFHFLSLSIYIYIYIYIEEERS